MTEISGAPVVVGVDGSESALDAVRLGATEADLRHRPLLVVHAFAWSQMRVPVGPVPGGPPEGGFRNAADRLVEAAVDVARRAAPSVPVVSSIDDGFAAPVLLRHARTAAMVVLGNRGLGGFGDLIIGSIAVHVAAHATCPVVVAKGTAHVGGPVVVGVDGSAVSDHAVGFAFDEADRRDVPLVAVHAWRYPVPTGAGDMLPLVYDLDQVGAEETALLAEATAGWCERYPDVHVTRRVYRSRPAKALVEESADAGLVVVGARGRGGFSGLLLGSVSHAVLHHAQCPVAIVRR